MPELPEVEAARRALEEHCIGKKILKCTVADDSIVIQGVSSEDFEAALVGKTIVAAHRKGKNMWLELDSPPFPSFQFGMAGAVYIKGVAITKYKRAAVKDTDEWPSKYSKLFVELADGLEFSFTDKRRFAKVRLLDNPVSVPPISELGPDALADPMTVDEFYNSLNKKKIGIKTLLLDQSFISGIGNWMADEVLYQARIHPIQTASSLSKESCTTLHKCINEVTNIAVEVDADSLRFPAEWLFHFRWGKKPGKVNAVEVGADSSQFPSNWIFHFREKKPGKAFIDGKSIEFINAGGRTSAFVPELQKLPGDQAVKEMGKRSKGKTAGKGKGGDESEDKDEPKKAKAMKEKKTSARKPSSKKKSGAKVEASDEDEDEDEDSNGADDGSPSPKRKRGAKNPPAKRNPRGGKKDEAEMKKTGGRSGPSKRKQEGSDDADDDDVSEDENGKQVKAVAASKKKKKAN